MQRDLDIERDLVRDLKRELQERDSRLAQQRLDCERYQSELQSNQHLISQLRYRCEDLEADQRSSSELIDRLQRQLRERSIDITQENSATTSSSPTSIAPNSARTHESPARNRVGGAADSVLSPQKPQPTRAAAAAQPIFADEPPASRAAFASAKPGITVAAQQWKQRLQNERSILDQWLAMCRSQRSELKTEIASLKSQQRAWKSTKSQFDTQLARTPQEEAQRADQYEMLRLQKSQLDSQAGAVNDKVRQQRAIEQFLSGKLRQLQLIESSVEQMAGPATGAFVVEDEDDLHSVSTLAPMQSLDEQWRLYVSNDDFTAAASTRMPMFNPTTRASAPTLSTFISRPPLQDDSAARSTLLQNMMQRFVVFSVFFLNLMLFSDGAAIVSNFRISCGTISNGSNRLAPSCAHLGSHHCPLLPLLQPNRCNNLKHSHSWFAILVLHKIRKRLCFESNLIDDPTRLVFFFPSFLLLCLPRLSMIDCRIPALPFSFEIAEWNKQGGHVNSHQDIIEGSQLIEAMKK